MNKLAGQYVLDIIRAKMGLTEEQTILRDQNFMYPQDRKLYVVAGLVGASTMAAGAYMQEAANQPGSGATVMEEVDMVIQREVIQIDIASRDTSAVFRNWEIVAALKSFLSQQTQEKNNFKIFKQASGPNNTSSAEGTAMLNRFTLTFIVFAWYRKTMFMGAGDYYDDFTVRVDDAHTIDTDTPLIEFEINEGGIVP